MTAPLPVFVVRLADSQAETIEAVLATSGLPRLSPFWRRHAANLLTLRVADPGGDLAARLAGLPGVDRVLALGGSRLYARWPHGTPSPVTLRHGAALGGGVPLVLAGPCSVEGPQQIRAIAELVAEAGASALRGGVFKPRTSPYDFGGLGAEGLRWLVEAGRATGLPTVTEVLDEGCQNLVAQQADVLQIGSRNMHDSSFLFGLGADPRGKPALLKRGFGATVDELLWAAEYFLLGRLAAGHEAPGLILCERGVRTFETSTRFTLDVGAIAVLRARTYLPIVVDPSHPAGDRELVPALAAAGLAAGADGLLVEVHTDPPRAWCDGAQSLTPDAFRQLMGRLADVVVS